MSATRNRFVVWNQRKLSVPIWTRILIILVVLGLLAGSVISVWMGNLFALLVVTPCTILALRALSFAFGK